MRKTALCVIASLLILTGCDSIFPWEKLATLEFGRSYLDRLPADAGVPKRRYVGQLQAGLWKLGIKPDDLDIVVDSDDRATLHVHVRKAALTPETRAIIKAYLIGILQARDQVNFEMTLTVTPRFEAAKRIDFAALRRSISVSAIKFTHDWLRIEAGPQAGIETTGINWRRASEQRQSLCYIGAFLQIPVPDRYESIAPLPGSRFTDEKGLEMHLTTRPDTQEAPQIALNARLKLKDASLARLLDERGVEVRLNMAPSKRSLTYRDGTPVLRMIDSAGFVFGHVDEPVAGAQPLTQWQPYLECEKRIADLGRPFSFYAGDTIDRLKYATFWDEP
ncbi:hypothetical protein PS3A_31190 [Pseudomonas sp. 3A(2025)]